jgi:signal transduction histidine kinase/HAMP domain-containing protein/FixJ family two-component response regulator
MSSLIQRLKGVTLNRMGSIKARLLTAVIILFAAIILAGTIAMYGLEQAGRDLTNLHRRTLSDVTQALELSKQTADLASSAPYLLSLKSPFLVSQESTALLEQFETTTDLIKSFQGGAIGPLREQSYRSKIGASLDGIHSMAKELVDISSSMISSRESIRVLRRQLLALDRKILDFSHTAPSHSYSSPSTPTGLRDLVNLLLSSATADNYITIGEHRRRYVELTKEMKTAQDNSDARRVLNQIKNIAEDNSGVFEIRKRVLGLTLEANNLLFQIQRESRDLNDTVFAFVRESEASLARRQDETAASITSGQIAIIVIGLISLLVAFGAGRYIARYVAGNLVSVADVMNRLAGGELDVKTPDGGQRNDEIGKLLRAFTVFRDNAFQIDRLNQDLVENSALLQSTFDNMTSGLAVFDRDGTLMTWNPKFPDVLEISPNDLLEGEHISSVFKVSGIDEQERNQLLARLNQILNDDTASLNDHDFLETQTNSGKAIVTRTSHLPNGGLVCLFSDVTERQRLSESLQRFRHLESLGKLTGEVAHDFNNLLSTIHGNLQLLQDNTSSDDRESPSHVYLERAIIASERSASLTQRLLAFARKQQLQPETVDLGELIEGMLELVEYSVGEGVSVTLAQDQSDLFVKIDPGQLENAILNLCINSGLAIADKGFVKIETLKTADDMCEISISDSGCGMEEDVLEKVFVPFFTTRKSGEGSGLGLSMVFGFIKQSGGEITVDSTVGSGTCVKMRLPLSSPDRKTQDKSEIIPHDARRGNGERVLIVEDLDDVRQATEGMIRDLGYTTITADSCSSAREILDNEPEVATVFSDINLQGDENGWAVVEYALRLRPETQTIVTSAVYSSDENVPQWIRDKTTFVPKPHSKQRLMMALAQAASQFNTEVISKQNDHESHPITAGRAQG